MIYTAVLQAEDGRLSVEAHVSTHDRSKAWYDIHDKRNNKKDRLVLLIDGQASVRTFEDVVDAPR